MSDQPQPTPAQWNGPYMWVEGIPEAVAIHRLRLEMLEQFMVVCLANGDKGDDTKLKKSGAKLDKAIERWIKAGKP